MKFTVRYISIKQLGVIFEQKMQVIEVHVNYNRPLCNSVIITANFSKCSIINTCHFLMQINKTT